MAEPFTEEMALSILRSERSPIHFEKFCCELFSAVEGRQYVPTSWNYDQGRDGRMVDVRDGETPPVICSTLRVTVLDKAEEDAKSLAGKPNPPRAIHFCCTQNLTEYSLDQVKNKFREQLPQLETILADGAYQLGALTIKYPNVFNKYYLSELASLRTALGVSEVDSEDIQITGMRIALTTQLTDDAAALRDDLQKNLVLTALADKTPRTVNGLCTQVSALLHLPKVVQPEYVYSAVQSLQDAGYVNQVERKYFVTESGLEEIKNRTDRGSETLASGQQAVRNILSELTGYEIDANAFIQMWKMIQDEIANMFLENGIYITEAIASIVQGETSFSEFPNLHEAIKRLGEKVANLNVCAPQGQEIGQAVTDMFHEVNSEAFNWLSGLSTVYVSLCSLGLDRRSQTQMEERLREIDLLLDTDVILSLLSPGEPQHGVVDSIVNAWKRINGRVYVTPCVLEETAYHAWIGEQDYREVWRILETMNDAESLRLIQNAFVRGFRVESKGKYNLSTWRYYIEMFRGADKYDSQKIEYLLKDQGVSVIIYEDIDNTFAKEVATAVLEFNPDENTTTAGGAKEETVNKCNRDGVLMSMLLKHRQERLRDNGTAVVISSSRRLRGACKEFKERFDQPVPIVPIGAIAYFLTFIPGVNLSLGALKGVLFDTGFAARLHGLDRIALRVLHASKEYFLPFARRGSLRMEMRKKVNKLASQRGQLAKEVEFDLIHGKGEVTADIATIVASAVDELASSKSEKRSAKLKKEILELKRQL